MNGEAAQSRESIAQRQRLRYICVGQLQTIARCIVHSGEILRELAAECIEMAKHDRNPDNVTRLTEMAQEWSKQADELQRAWKKAKMERS